MQTTALPESSITAGGDIPPRKRSVIRRRLDGPVIVQRASSPGRCATCQRRYGRGTRVTWLPGSGTCHAQCAPASTQDQPMRAARALAAHAKDAAELRELLVMAGLISPHAARRARLAARRAS